MKTKIRILSGCVLCMSLSVAGCGNSPTANDEQTAYRVLSVGTSDVTLRSVYSASVRGKQDVEIRPQVSGLITAVHVTEGQRVCQGQPLFTLDQVAYRAALKTAQANVEVAQAEVEIAALAYASKQTLHACAVVSDYELKTAQSTLTSAQAKLAQASAQMENAENDLSYTVVKSPANGVVGTLPYRVGALVGPSIATPLTSVSDNSEMYVYFSLSENQILTLTETYGSLDQAVAAMPSLGLKLGTGHLYKYAGHVESISGVIDRTTGCVSVRAVFPNDEGILLSGATGSVVYPYELNDVIAIPQEATFELQDKKFVYKVVNGKAEATQIDVYPVNDGTTYAVMSGLKSGDEIVAEGVGLIKNGDKLKLLRE
ncbi:MAG: efflux RND transporter periplasmic adaptor subunit [Paludibacteraceae bacterium]